MPWRTRKQGSKHIIEKKEGGKWVKVGESDSKAKAEASIRAREAGKRKKG